MPLEMQDSVELVEAVQESMGEIMPWMDWCTPKYDEMAAKGWISDLESRCEAGTQYAFSVRDSPNGMFLGVVGLNHINPTQRIGNLGYWIRSSRTKQGIATQASMIVAMFGLENLKLLRAEIVVAVGNKASLRVAEKTGARREGVLRNRLIVRDEVHNAVMHSLISEDFT